MKKLLLICTILLTITATSTYADANNHDTTQIASCIEEGLISVLNGSIESIDITLMTRQVIGPSARSMDASDILIFSDAIEYILKSNLKEKAIQYGIRPTILDLKIKISARDERVFIGRGKISTRNEFTYSIQIYGYRTTADSRECKFYALNIADVFTTRGWLQDQAQIQILFKQFGL